MKDFYLKQARPMAIELLVIAAIIVAILLYHAQYILIMGIFLGYLTAFICVGTMAQRLWKASFLAVKQAKRQMYIGLIIRLSILIGTMHLAAVYSEGLFQIALMSFLLGFAVIMLNLILYVYQLNMR